MSAYMLALSTRLWWLTCIFCYAAALVPAVYPTNRGQKHPDTDVDTSKEAFPQ